MRRAGAAHSTVPAVRGRAEVAPRAAPDGPLLPSVTARGANPEPPLALQPILAALIYVTL